MDSSLGQHTDSNLESIENRPLLDPKQTLAAITELNIVRKNIQIYPLAHVQVKQSIEKAFKILGNALETDPQITIGVAKDTLLVGNIDLDSKNRVSHELAIALRRLGVAAVSFYHGMGKNELVGFVQWLRHTEKPDQDKKKENSECQRVPRFPHIRIQIVDYSRFHATEEDEITREPGDKENHTRGSIWHGFISNLMAGPKFSS